MGATTTMLPSLISKHSTCPVISKWGRLMLPPPSVPASHPR
ncbi:hypothetical protein GLE_5536 [Lysobacter enzymogenes]|uniref:Uncharacterized protein n=1 Tax=Lysobacter enzymogenes TaxID=69 RepID=A0A0S2DR63_LYSEN|nr:hypothetical protein GLE_5536 [Lysobacter enzymogenes]